MKQWKKFMLVFMCTGIMMGLTACGNNTDDNAANDNSATEGTTGTDDTVKDDVTDRNNEMMELWMKSEMMYRMV